MKWTAVVRVTHIVNGEFNAAHDLRFLHYNNKNTYLIYALFLRYNLPI